MLSVDIQGDAPAPDGRLELAITEITFIHNDGGAERFSLDETLIFDQDGLSLTRLLNGEELREGNYNQIQLTVDADNSEYDSDGGSVSNALGLAGGTIVATANNRQIRIRDSESENVILHFSSFASLPTPEDGDEEQSLNPVMTMTRSAYSYDLSVTLASDETVSRHCSDTDNQLPRLYLFDTNSSDEDNDVNGASDDPLRVVFAQASTSANISRTWALENLPEGRYRIALSCDDDDPAQDDDIAFFCASTLDFSAATTIALDAASSDANCS